MPKSSIVPVIIGAFGAAALGAVWWGFQELAHNEAEKVSSAATVILVQRMDKSDQTRAIESRETIRALGAIEARLRSNNETRIADTSELKTKALSDERRLDAIERQMRRKWGASSVRP